jgi:hypothetical protein
MKSQDFYGAVEATISKLPAILALLFAFAIILAIVMPAEQVCGLRSGRETIVISTLITIHCAQTAFHARNGRYGTLKELADLEVIEPRYASREPVRGYIYSDSEVTENTYCVHSTRQKDDSSYADFNITEEGAVHFIKSKTRGIVPRGAGEKLMTAEDDEQEKN